ncbi:MAG: CCA tRNA nucleotidyltransferase [Candidatus Levybacteria bacterium]|nr:CCA tRNA nucleotidyltransferase [Candidatus Levybacteria bacterium]
MFKLIDPDVIQIYRSLEKAGYEVYFVGGCVRNLLMDVPVNDWDLTTNATPDQIQELFPDSFCDNPYGTVGVKFENEKEGKGYAEITTFRTEKGYKDFRHPDEVIWGTTLKEDVERRDFTVNALAIKIVDTDKTEIIDLVNGKEDLDNKLIKAVGDPDARFKEDALRLMRAVRFSAQLGFQIEEKTLESIIKDAHLIEHVSSERIRDELLKILETQRAYEGMILLDEIGILDIIFPELLKGKGVSQARPGRHHTTDVFTHNMLSLKETPTSDPIVKLSALLHDVGKPYVASKDNEGYIIFYNHEVVGAKISKEIALRLHLSNKQKEKIYTLIRWHMFTVDEHITDSAVRRFIRRVGLENVKDMMDLRIGDRLGGGTQTAESWRLRKFKERLEEQLHPPFSINDMEIDGNDIMQELNIPPGKKVGVILQKLFEEVDEDLSKNNKDYLITRLKVIESEV